MYGIRKSNFPKDNNCIKSTSKPEHVLHPLQMKLRAVDSERAGVLEAEIDKEQTVKKKLVGDVCDVIQKHSEDTTAERQAPEEDVTLTVEQEATEEDKDKQSPIEETVTARKSIKKFLSNRLSRLFLRTSRKSSTVGETSPWWNQRNQQGET